jgi:hypothetical protein
VYAAAITLLVSGVAAVLYAFLIVPLHQRVAGNSKITVYGRIVDQSGSPISNAAVKYRVTYSDSAVRPVMFGREEKFKLVTTQTDSNGDYCLDDVYGYFVNLAGVMLAHRELQSAMGVPCPVETGWSLEDQFQLKTMPRTPDQRITYSFRLPTKD